MNEDEAIFNLYSEEIRHVESAQFFLDWLLDLNSYKSTSGDSYFLEKKDNKIITGNLFDEDFEEIFVSKEKLIRFLREKISSKE